MQIMNMQYIANNKLKMEQSLFKKKFPAGANCIYLLKYYKLEVCRKLYFLGLLSRATIRESCL